jgi:disulfide bond formation protein DsbB
MNKLIEYLQVPRHLAAAVAAVSIAALAAAYISQYGFGLKPCILCLYQRVPYFVNIALGALAFLVSFRYPRLVTLFLWLSVAGFLIGAAIAGFHVGVEQGWWKGLSSCGGDILPENVSIEELRKAITQQPIVRCDQPAWTLFGISMAGYNYVMSTLLACGVVYLLRKNKP